METHMIMACDPGLSGAIAFLDPAIPTTVETADLPVHLLVRGGRKKRELDISGLIGILTAHQIDHAFVERVGAMPGQGVSSMFAFGKTYGVLLGVIAAHSIPLTLVAPIVWKRALAVPKAKDGARARASQLLPDAAHQWPRVHHHSRAEAALLALYGARKLNGAAG